MAKRHAQSSPEAGSIHTVLLSRQTDHVDQVLPDPGDEGAGEEAAFKAVARRSRRTPAAVALAAIAVLAVALLTKGAPPSASAPTAAVTPQPSLAQAVTSSTEPTDVLGPAPTSAAPSRNPTVTPHPTFVAVPAEAGVTQLVPAGPTPVRLTILLPDGWRKASDALYVKSNGVAQAGMSIGAWRLQHVNIVPCRWSSQEFAEGPLMRSAEGQAQALSAWWGQDPKMPPNSNSTIAPLATKPQLESIQGYPAWYLEVVIPRGLDVTECDGGQIILWDTADGVVRSSSGPGELIQLWVVDVDSEIIVIDAAVSGPVGPDPELQSIIDSIVIEP